mmetsp:Transcript_1699/g.3549  ORF Transcript_1699/g.3549 Transcript_1699/m.3549 type:complete len:157 (-) Transcript_1699:781-1251(-)
MALPEGTIKSGWCKKLGGVVKNWKQRFLVLLPQKLCYFVDEESALAGVKNAKGTINLTEVKCAIGKVEGGCKAGQYCFSLKAQKRVYYICVESSEQQEAWVQALLHNGATIEDEDDDAPAEASSIFEFSVKDANNDDVKMDAYRGKVCCIVNVASF